MCLSCHGSDEIGFALCPSCDTERLQAQEGTPQGLTDLGKVPLEDRESGRSLPLRAIDTYKFIFFNPAGFFARLVPSTSLILPLAFGYISAFIGLGLAAIWQIVFEMPGLEEQRALAAEMGMPAGAADAALILSVPLQAAFYLGINTLILHLAARIVGGKAPLKKTFQLYAYSSGALLLNAIPVIGMFASIFVQISAQFVGLRILHGLTLGRALLACIIPLGFLLLLGP